MADVKKERTKEGEEKHFSVGALIKKDGKYLLIERRIYPPGFAAPAGHINEGESPEEAVKREVEEEVGLKIKNLKEVFHEQIDDVECHMAVKHHEWRVYECEWSGEVHESLAETKGYGWYAPDSIKGLKLEPTWQYFFAKLLGWKK